VDAGWIAGGSGSEGWSPGIGEWVVGVVVGRGGCGASGNVIQVQVRICVRTLGVVDEGRRLVDAEGATIDYAFGVAGGEIGEEFAAIVVDTGSGADYDLVVETFGTPGDAQAWGESPLAAGEGGVADTLAREKFVVAGDDDSVEAGARGIDGIGGVVVGVARGIEIEDAAVFFGEAAIPIPTQAGGKG